MFHKSHYIDIRRISRPIKLNNRKNNKGENEKTFRSCFYNFSTISERNCKFSMPTILFFRFFRVLPTIMPIQNWYKFEHLKTTDRYGIRAKCQNCFFTCKLGFITRAILFSFTPEEQPRHDFFFVIQFMRNFYFQK